MENNNYSWKTRLFSKTWNIYRNNRQVGFIKKSFWSQKSIAEINGRQYLFQESGFFNRKTNIIDIAENKIIGTIKYGSWGNKATVEMNGEISNWRYTNTWNTKWAIHDSKGLSILYKGSSFSENGQIETNGDVDVKLLMGLYIYSYFLRMLLAVLIILFTPTILRFLLH